MNKKMNEKKIDNFNKKFYKEDFIHIELQELKDNLKLRLYSDIFNYISGKYSHYDIDEKFILSEQIFDNINIEVSIDTIY